MKVFLLYLTLFGLVGVVVQRNATGPIQAFFISALLCANVIVWISTFRRKAR